MGKHPYAGRTAALATRHGKEIAIAPPFRDAVQLDIVLADIDTDAFGTFTGELPRRETPFNTAIAKARAGIERSGLPLGLASEGTIGPDSQLPFVTSDLEIIVFIDLERDIVISEWTRATNVIAFRAVIRPEDDIGTFAARADFPRHGVIVKSTEGDDSVIFKGIADELRLDKAIKECFAQTGSAIIENDFRAYHSPTRMAVISNCATRLAQKVASLCPECSCPGWGRVEPARGLPCSECGTFVATAIRADRDGCPSCEALRETARPVKHVDPRWCPGCNP